MERSRAWWQSRSRAFLPECACLIEDRIGHEAVEAVFLCGSFAAGEESVVLETDPPVLLSDVDIVAIVKTFDTLTRWSRRRAELGNACEELWREIRFSGRVDVGVMLAEDLAALPAKPGVYDMRTLGKVLTGRTAILERIPAYEASDIAVQEAIALIENRSVALIDTRPGGEAGKVGEAYRFLYGIARAYTDAATAALCTAGAYLPGYAARAERIRAKAPEKGNCVSPELVDSALQDKIARWTAFKLEPSIAAAGVERARFDALWEEAAHDLLVLWKGLKSGAFDRRSGSAGISPGARAGRSGLLSRARDNARGWKTRLSDLPVSRRIALCAALGWGLLSRSPIETVREEGMRLLDHRMTRGAAVPLRGARGGFPYRGGSWDRAAEELCSAWNGIVFGREDG